MNDNTSFSKQSSREHLSFAHRMKKQRILLSYQWDKFRRKLSPAYVLFVISFFLFLLVLIPTFAHRLSLPGDWPLVLELRGTTVMKANASDPYSSRIPAEFVKIEIGGYSANSAYDGTFDIRFASPNFGDIPVILTWSNGTRIFRVSFLQGQYDQTVEFTVE